ncbi:hypothetical protein GLS40_04445 [Pseudooceanicola sp. 216_PA32_1]|uniref:MotA/TolQ/ExbB proton channel domain-containing protein n=1 Tax=Pseudooceanicola pacificus TaxID=2676438 RepID=A0A844VZN8_9RHOB|nr:hypothetical protein [Pseudooceanicola pacificus]MWB77266.1 hypothetical protein [Pseudooceanicola pacificus]
MDIIVGLGEAVRSAILAGAGLLKAEHVPGLVVVAILGLLAGTLVHLYHRARINRRALSMLHDLVSEAGDGAGLADQIAVINRQMVDREKYGNPAERSIGAAWREYRETLIQTDEDGTKVLRNSVRPASIFNVEDLGFGPGFYRMMPSLFVSGGLFLTFLGLIAALDDMGSSMVGEGTAALTSLLTVASAKFIMSLTGLGSSIVFSIFLRRWMDGIQSATGALSRDLERRLSYVSLEDLAVRQLAQSRAQMDEMRRIGTELVTQLANPLRDELPERISTAIAGAMEPVASAIRQQSTSGLEGLVDGMSSQLSGSVAEALGRAGDRFDKAGDRIGLLVKQLALQSGRMGAGMEEAVGQMTRAMMELQTQLSTSAETASNTMTAGADRMLEAMNETLDGIRVNTGKGARALAIAASEMRTAAASIRSEMESAAQAGSEAAAQRLSLASGDAESAIHDAGRRMVETFGETSAELARMGQAMTGTVGTEIVGRLESLGKQIEEVLAGIDQSAEGFREIAGSVRDSAGQVDRAGLAIGSATDDLTRAIEPVRSSHERIEASLAAATEATRQTGEAVRGSGADVARNAVEVLETARVALGSEREGIAATLATVRETLNMLRGQGDRFDEIDEKLGAAFETYRENVEATLTTAEQHVRELHSILEPGVSTLREVVDQAESFIPVARRA